MYYYAQINEENICIGVSSLYEEVSNNNLLISLDFYDNSLLGKKYNDGVWEEVAPLPQEPTQLDRIETKVDEIANGTTTENTEAINALLLG